MGAGRTEDELNDRGGIEREIVCHYERATGGGSIAAQESGVGVDGYRTADRTGAAKHAIAVVHRGRAARNSAVYQQGSSVDNGSSRVGVVTRKNDRSGTGFG